MQFNRSEAAETSRSGQTLADDAHLMALVADEDIGQGTDGGQVSVGDALGSTDRLHGPQHGVDEHINVLDCSVDVGRDTETGELIMLDRDGDDPIFCQEPFLERLRVKPFDM